MKKIIYLNIIALIIMSASCTKNAVTDINKAKKDSLETIMSSLPMFGEPDTQGINKVIELLDYLIIHEKDSDAAYNYIIQKESLCKSTGKPNKAYEAMLQELEYLPKDNLRRLGILQYKYLHENKRDSVIHYGEIINKRADEELKIDYNTMLIVSKVDAYTLMYGIKSGKEYLKRMVEKYSHDSYLIDYYNDFERLASESLSFCEKKKDNSLHNNESVISVPVSIDTIWVE